MLRGDRSTCFNLRPCVIKFSRTVGLAHVSLFPVLIPSVCNCLRVTSALCQELGRMGNKMAKRVLIWCGTQPQILQLYN